MYSGFITHKRVIKRLGVHQRFDIAAYHMIQPFLPPDRFPQLEEILHFEGYNGPDGLKVKSPGVAEPSHLYDPETDSGEVPMHIRNHYDGLVAAMVEQDKVRSAFEAAWLAHYVCDGMTPAHHFPLEDRIQDLKDNEVEALARGDLATALARWRRRWGIWGAKGLLSTHFNFEMGIALTLLTNPMHDELDQRTLAQAKRLGPVDFFKVEAREVAQLNLYDRFYEKGWTADLASTLKKVVAPRAASAIAITWLLAILEAEQKQAVSDASHRR